MELLNLSVPEQHDYNDPTVQRDDCLLYTSDAADDTQVVVV